VISTSREEWLTAKVAENAEKSILLVFFLLELRRMGAITLRIFVGGAGYPNESYEFVFNSFFSQRSQRALRFNPLLCSHASIRFEKSA
jgi:hypothetical protein